MQRQPETVVLPKLYAVPGAVHAVREGDLVYIAGLTARRSDGTVIGRNDLGAQAEKVYAALGEVLQAAGASWNDIVKVNYYVAPQACSAPDRETLRHVEARHVPPQNCAALGIGLEMDDPDLLIQVEAIAYLARDKTVINGVPGLPQTRAWAHAVHAGSTLYTSVQLPFDAGLVSADESISIKGGLGQQTLIAYQHLGRILEVAAMKWEDAVQVHQFLTPPRLTIDELQAARTKFLTMGRFLSTSVRCRTEHPDFPMHDWLISVDMEADARPRRPIQAKETWGNPPGPHAFVTGSLMRMHGQVSRNLELQSIHENDPAQQAETIYRNIGEVLSASGSGWDRVLHVRNFCKRRADMPIVKKVQNRCLPAGRATTTDLIADFFDPKLLVEVEVVARTS